METFADQAAIAIENARLLTELQARTGELTRSVQELQALGEVSQALSSTLDLDTVLRTIVARANQLAGTDGCSVWEYEEGTGEFHFRATDNLDEAVIEVSRRTPIRRGQGNMGRMAADPRAGPDSRHRCGRRLPRPPPRCPVADGKPRPPGRPAAARGPPDRRADRQQEDAGRVLARGHRPAQDLRGPVGPGRPERAPVPGDRGQEPSARGGRSPQVRVPGQHVPRAAHAAERHHRLQRDAAGGRGRPRRRAVHRRSREDQQRGQAPAGADQRGPRSVQDRGRARWSSTSRASTWPGWSGTSRR